MLSSPQAGQLARVWYREAVAASMPWHARLCIVVVAGTGRPRNHQVVIVVAPDEPTPDSAERVVVPAGHLQPVDRHGECAVWAEKVGAGLYEARYCRLTRRSPFTGREDPSLWASCRMRCPLGGFATAARAVEHGKDAIDLARSVTRGWARPLSKLPSLRRDPFLKDWVKKAKRIRAEQAREERRQLRRSGVVNG